MSHYIMCCSKLHSLKCFEIVALFGKFDDFSDNRNIIFTIVKKTINLVMWESFSLNPKTLLLSANYLYHLVLIETQKGEGSTDLTKSTNLQTICEL